MATEPDLKNYPLDSSVPRPEVSPAIQFKFRNEAVSLPVGDVNALFVDISRYNDHFSLASLLSQAVLGRFKSKAPDASETGLSTVNSEAQFASSAELQTFHRGTLEKLGLSLEPVSGKGGTLMASGEEPIGAGEMRLNIADRNQFLAFLKGVTPEQITGSVLEENLHDLSMVLSQQILDNYNLEKPTDEAIQLLGSFEPIVAEYQRLGIGGTEKLETCLTHVKQGDLREYVLVERTNLLAEPGKNFGPADWQRDSTPEYLLARWESALKVIDYVSANPRAGELRDRLFTHLTECLRLAKDNLDTLDYLDPERKQELQAVLDQVGGQLG